MNFIELFKEQFYFIGCDISREIINHGEIKITTFPKEVLKKVVELANCALRGTASHAELRLRREYEGNLVPSLSDTNVNGSSWIDEYNAYASHTKCYAVLTGKISEITVLDFDTL